MEEPQSILKAEMEDWEDSLLWLPLYDMCP